MSSSDNVLRCGLTPKYVDAQELIKIVNFKAYMPQVISADSSQRFCYYTPCSEFLLEKIKLKSGEQLTIDSKQFCAPVIGIVTKGELSVNGMSFKKGESFFISQRAEQLLFKGDFTLYIAGGQNKS
jgi:mannose-6-phosphate isomerase